jgi:hypothetical protein
VTGHRCPLCGTPGAACGAGGDVLGVPVGILAEQGKRMPGKVEYRWVRYGTEWRVFRINASDPLYPSSMPYMGPDSAPMDQDPFRNGASQVSTVDKQQPENPVQNKARTTQAGGRRGTGAGTKRRGSKVEPTEQKEGDSADE